MTLTPAEIQIEQKLTRSVDHEREAVSAVLKDINALLQTDVIAKRGCSSLFDYLVRKQKYSGPAAMRRIRAAEALRAVPEIESKLDNGTLNLTVLSNAQSRIIKHEEITKSELSSEQRAQVFEKIEFQTKEQAEKTLFEILPEASAAYDKRDRKKRVSATSSRLEFELSDPCAEKMKRVRELIAHANPNASAAEVIERALDFFLEKHDPLKKPAARASTTKNVEQVSELLKRAIIQRDNGECQFVDHETGFRCASTYLIQIDHIQPVAMGGTNELVNLRCLCAIHNRLMARVNLAG